MVKKIFILISVSVILTLTACGQKTKATKPTNANTSKQTTTDTKIFGANLIKNGDAETGDGRGWTNADELKTIVYGDFGGGPTRESAGAPNRGDKYFYARTTTEQPTAIFMQTINLPEIGNDNDKKIVEYNFGGWFGVANGSSSAGRLKLTFFDAGGKELKQDATAEIDETNRPADEVMIEKNGSGNLPVGTRKIEIVLEFKIFKIIDAQQDNLAFADNLSLVLTNKGTK